MPDVLDAVRVRINDMIVSIGGQTLTNNAPFTLPMCNVAWQRSQQFLVSLGYVVLEDNITIPGLPPASDLDPAKEVTLSWSGYDNGSGTLNTAFVLPQSLIRPVSDGLQERISVTSGVNTAALSPMDEILGTLANVAKGMWNQQWQWRADKIVMPGARTNTDLSIRFAKYLADFTNLNTDVAPIMRCEDMLSGFICAEFAGGRGDLDRATFLTEAQQAAMIIAGIDVKDMMLGKVAERGKMRDRYDGAAA